MGNGLLVSLNVAVTYGTSYRNMVAEGAVCVVFGASRGIGLGVCRRMAKIGYSVVCASRDLTKCREAVEDFPQSEKGQH